MIRENRRSIGAVILNRGVLHGGEMMGGALRVLQTGGFRLDEPFLPTPGVPRPLRNILLEARYSAARTVFTAAIDRQVDLVLLAGNICDLQRDRRSLWFLNEQFQRLRDAGIDVIWVENTTANQLSSFDFPANVRVLTANHSIGFRLQGAERTVEIDWACAVGEQQTHGDTSDLLIHVAEAECGRISRADYTMRGCGDTFSFPVPELLKERDSNAESTGLILIDCSTHETRQSEHRTLDAVDNMVESVSVDDSTTWHEFCQMLHHRLDAICESATAALTLVNWSISGAGVFWREMSDAEMRQKLLSELCARGETQPHPVWTTGITLDMNLSQLDVGADSECLSVGLEEWNRLLGRAESIDLRGLDAVTSSGPDWGLEAEYRPSQKMQLRLVRELMTA